MTEAEQIAAFLAKRGATKIAAGETALDYSRRDWADAVRGNTPRARKAQPAPNARVRMVTDHAGREFYRNEEGEWL